MINPNLQDKVVLITGANHGIGAATAKAFADQGAKVFITFYREPTDYAAEALQAAKAAGIGGDALYRARQQQDADWLVHAIGAAGGTAVAHEMDLADPANILRLFELCEGSLGPVDVLVNNHTFCVLETFDPAQVSTEQGEARFISAAMIDRHFAINTRAYALLMAEYVQRYLKRRATWGRIINISTDAAHAHSWNVSYAASKHAIESYSRSAAAELGKYGITVNIIAPGPIQTGYIIPEATAEIRKGTPLGDVGKPEQIADVVVFLASEQARWLTGQLLYVGGGWRMGAVMPFAKFVIETMILEIERLREIMQLIQRMYGGLHDQERMMALVRAHPQDNFHIVDLPYRFSSWAFDNADNITLWEDEQGELLAWAVLQTPFWAIDYAYHPGIANDAHPHLLAWANERARQLVGSAFGRPIWFVNVFDWQTARQQDLAAQGFFSVADWGENSWTKVLLHHQQDHTLSSAPLPPGYTLRPLAGVQEAAAYVALHRAVFESENMTTAWRERTLQHPAYQPELDLVIADPAGQLAAFCIGWLAANGIDGQPSGQIEPMGVRADCREHGLGRAILSETVRRLYAKGAAHIVVETDNYRDAAFALYEAVGFRVQHNVLVFRKDYPSQTGAARA